MITSYGTMLAVRDADGLRFLIPAFSTPNARTDPTIVMVRSLLAELTDSGALPADEGGRRVLVVQYDDRSHLDVGSVAYCRRRGAAGAVQLLPDTYFFFSRGYRWLREPVERGALPAWEARQDVVFWRGSPTNHERAIDGSPIERIEQIPRVAMCLALRDAPATDAAIMAHWGFIFSFEQMMEYFFREGIFRPAIPMLRQASYRYLIDIDGVASAWSFFEKLLLGACVLKIGSPFEQWYYPELEEWRHFVPVRADLGDLVAQVEWCREHPRQAREIAEEGQRFALGHGFEAGHRVALDAIRRSLLTLDE